MALQAGCPPHLISVNGVPKDEDHIRRSIQAGARLTIDSLEEIDVIERAAAELGTTATVRLRLKPVLSRFIEHTDFVAEGLAPTDIAAIAYKGGLTFEQVMAAGPRLLEMPNVKLVGFHQHHGRHKRSVRCWEAQMAAYAAEIGRVWGRWAAAARRRASSRRRSTSAAGSPSRAIRSTPRPTTASRSSTPPSPRFPGC
jgi:diaminopimelate decarboxylase